jgi:hypothetical protein
MAHLSLAAGGWQISSVLLAAETFLYYRHPAFHSVPRYAGESQDARVGSHFTAYPDGPLGFGNASFERQRPSACERSFRLREFLCLAYDLFRFI